MRTPKEYNLMSKAHKLAKELQEDEFNLHYHIALSRALKRVWLTLNRINEVETAFTKEEKSLILSSLSNHNTLKLYYHSNNELIEKLIPYAWKNNYFWHDKKGHQFYFSQEIINNLR